MHTGFDSKSMVHRACLLSAATIYGIIIPANFYHAPIDEDIALRSIFGSIFDNIILQRFKVT